jgi:hypothetical protein
MRIWKRGACAVIALTLCGAWMPGKDYRQEFALQLQPLVPGYVITAKLVCGSGYNECLKEASRTKVWVKRLTPPMQTGAGTEPAPPAQEHFVVRLDEHDKEHNIVYTLTGNPLCPGDQVMLQYASGDYSGLRAVLPSDDDFKSAVKWGPDKHSVTVYFPSTQLLVMRVEDANGLKQPPTRVVPRLKDGLWTAEFAGIPEGKGLKLVFSVGVPPDRRDYPAIPVPDVTATESAAAASAQPVAYLPAQQNKLSPEARLRVQQALLRDPVAPPQPVTAKANATPAIKADANPDPPSPAAMVVEPTTTVVKSTVAESKLPATVIQVVEGASVITGYDKTFDKVRVMVMEGEDVVDQSEAAVDKDTGKFTATLAQPVGADQKVKFYVITGDKVSEGRSVAVLPAEMDWGRVRAYFTLGLLISAPGSNQLNGSTASPFLALTVDKNWLRPRTAVQQRVRLNTFFDARLTSIAAVTDNSKGTTVAPFPTATSVLADKHAGSLQVGGYLPVVLTNYFFRNHQYSLYVAPLAKFGFYQLTDSTTDTNGNTTLNNASFYKFHTYGLRVGHYKEYVDWEGRGNTHHSPEQLSYIDFTVGKWGNYEYARSLVPDAKNGCTADPAPGGTVASCAVLRQQAWRYGFEGILRIPYTPFILGLNANISAQRLHLPGFTPPGDDLRFLFGMRFDSRKLLNGIAKIGGN